MTAKRLKALLSKQKGPPSEAGGGLDDWSLRVAFETVRLTAERGIWEPGATSYPWNVRNDDASD